MKAIVIHAYGGAEQLKYEDRPDPEPGAGEVRVRIHAAGVNPVDVKIRKGLLQQRMPNVLPIIPGWDASGVIDRVGPGVTQHRVGDEVYAYCRKPVLQHGAYAEFIVLPETQVAPKPKSIGHAAAASIPLSALTAWQSLHDAAGIQAGQTVLIHAGAGGVGGFAIQLSRNAGAHVIATASSKNHAYVKGLGAHDAIDYTQVDFRDELRRRYPGGVDIAFDTVGGEVQTQSVDVVRAGGSLVSILALSDETKGRAQGRHLHYVFVAPNREQLMKLADLVDAGKFVSRRVQSFALRDAAVAHLQIETGHTVGKLVLEVGG